MSLTPRSDPAPAPRRKQGLGRYASGALEDLRRPPSSSRTFDREFPAAGFGGSARADPADVPERMGGSSGPGRRSASLGTQPNKIVPYVRMPQHSWPGAALLRPQVPWRLCHRGPVVESHMGRPYYGRGNEKHPTASRCAIDPPGRRRRYSPSTIRPLRRWSAAASRSAPGAKFLLNGRAIAAQRGKEGGRDADPDRDGPPRLPCRGRIRS